MASYVTPKRGAEYIFYISLVSQSTGQFQSSATIAAGDFKISKDGGALANLATLPAVTPAASKAVKVTLSATEMTADNIVVIGSDAAGAEWDDVFINIQTSARQIDDLAFPTTSGRSIDVSTTGEVEANLTQIDGQATSGNNATLNLKKLSIYNPNAAALVVISDTSYAIDVSSTDSRAVNIQSVNDIALSIQTANGDEAINVEGGGSYGIYIYGEGNSLELNAGTGKSINATDGINILKGISVSNNSGDALALNSVGGKSINAPQDIALPSGDLDDQLQALPTAAENATSVWAADTRTLTSFGTLVADIWANATRTLTAISDSAGVTTLLSRIGGALNITGGKVESNVKQINDADVTGDGSSGNPWGPA